MGADPRTRLNGLEAEADRLAAYVVLLEKRVAELERLILSLTRSNVPGKELKRVGT